MKGSLIKGIDLSNVTKSIDHLCPSCRSKAVVAFHEIKSVPVHSVLNIPTREAALGYPKGDISLVFCQNCGFIFNVLFDPKLLEYSSNCEESQGFSPTYNAFARRLATYLIERYNLYQKDILEIGCGKGEFLALLCELGDNRGIGFDPAYIEGRNSEKPKNKITFIKDYYSEKYTNYYGVLICCRMTLEHIYDTGNFISTVRRSIGDRTDTIVFFQVPDVTRILQNCAFEDIYYEHCSYFTPASLARLFRKSGFELLNLQTEYDGQYLVIEARPASGEEQPRFPQENDLEKLKEYVFAFKNKCNEKINAWRVQLQKFRTNGQRVVVWGSGSKGVSFLTTLGIYDEIHYVVDINPYRHGSYMAGSGQLVVPPGFLKEYQPHIVIIMNPIYREEIERDLNQMRLRPEILTL